MSSSEIVFRVLFWLSAGVVAYAYVGYPLLVWALAAAFGRRRESPGESRVDAAFVSVLIVAHNEEDVIADRLENALALEYAPDRLEIIVASDGSSDRTVEIAEASGDPRVRVLGFSRQRGKAAVLNEVI